VVAQIGATFLRGVPQDRRGADGAGRDPGWTCGLRSIRCNRGLTILRPNWRWRLETAPCNIVARVTAIAGMVLTRVPREAMSAANRRAAAILSIAAAAALANGYAHAGAAAPSLTGTLHPLYVGGGAWIDSVTGTIDGGLTFELGPNTYALRAGIEVRRSFADEDDSNVYAQAQYNRTFGKLVLGAKMVDTATFDSFFQSYAKNEADLSISMDRPFSLSAHLGAAQLTPGLRFVERWSDVYGGSRSEVRGSLLLSASILGGYAYFGAAYGYRIYRPSGIDQLMTLTTGWGTDLSEDMSLSWDAKYIRDWSTRPGKSYSSFEIGPTLEVSFD
jgi:hypothetical protein